MERCAICGQEFSIAHSCPGVSAHLEGEPNAWESPHGFAPYHYLRMAIGIARFEDEPILAASRDRNSIFYGLIIWIITCLLISAPDLDRSLHSNAGRFPVAINWIVFGFALLFMIVMITAIQILEYALCHWLARLLFGGRATFPQVLRVLLLGSLVQWALIIPVVGLLVGTLWSIAVLMRTFEEVEGIPRLKAFGISVCVSVPFNILSIMLSTQRH
jgi:hypothetical protein